MSDWCEKTAEAIDKVFKSLSNKLPEQHQWRREFICDIVHINSNCQVDSFLTCSDCRDIRAFTRDNLVIMLYLLGIRS